MFNSVQPNRPLLETRSLTIGYRKTGKKDVALFSQQDLHLGQGQLVGLLGPNGSGKSTLIRTLSGIQSPLAGAVLMNGMSIHGLSVRRVARMLSVVLTERIDVRNLTVFELVSMGRYPYTNWLGHLAQEDRHCISEALERVNLSGYADQYLHELSDGEQQRVMVAKALSQNTSLIFLDEPTAHLDLPNRVAIMQLLKDLAAETNKCILFSSHELDLTLQSADTLWLMRRNQPVLTGMPEELVLNGAFEETFHSDGVSFDRKAGSFKMMNKQHIPICCIGNDVNGFWTHRALEREGFLVSEDENLSLKITILTNPSRWILVTDGNQETFTGLEPLIRRLATIKNLPLEATNAKST